MHRPSDAKRKCHRSFSLTQATPTPSTVGIVLSHVALPTLPPSLSGPTCLHLHLLHLVHSCKPPTTSFTMADPFEVRMRFTTLLSHLSASHTSQQKAAVFALKNREMDEDLHSCILEQLERNSMNNRANIMYFIEHLCDLAAKEGAVEFVRMMQRDILRVVEAVCPGDGSGAANVRVVRKVLQALQTKSLLLPETVTELEAVLSARDIAPSHPFLAELPNGSKPIRNGSNGRLDKRQIEQRIEEDRERHKRMRESIWAVNGEDEKEMDRLWEEGSAVNEDDYLEGEEDQAERQLAIRFG
jgi:CTD kinase subunit gamma